MARWTFLTNHAQVLLCVARRDHLTAREIAATVGITERAVQRIVDELAAAGYVSKAREGRSNRYQVHADAPMRHPAQHGHTVHELIELLSLSDHQPSSEKEVGCRAGGSS